MRSGTPSLGVTKYESRHAVWRDSPPRHAVWRDSPATSDATFSNATVDISRTTSCGVTQVLVVPRGLARPKGLLIRILVGLGLVLKFYIKKG
jgi:hypothetical protein